MNGQEIFIGKESFYDNPIYQTKSIICKKAKKRVCFCQKNYLQYLKYNKNKALDYVLVIFENCKDVFHAKCIKKKNIKENVIKDKKCFICNFLENKGGEDEFFSFNKLSWKAFQKLHRAYLILNNFYKSEGIDFVQE